LQASISPDVFALELVARPGREERAGTLALLELVPLASILFWLQQLRGTETATVRIWIDYSSGRL
jgi:hypothetical protein